jgi:hypothetical protein
MKNWGLNQTEKLTCRHEFCKMPTAALVEDGSQAALKRAALW